jgi:hypothetical protein
MTKNDRRGVATLAYRDFGLGRVLAMCVGHGREFTPSKGTEPCESRGLARDTFRNLGVVQVLERSMSV